MMVMRGEWTDDANERWLRQGGVGRVAALADLDGNRAPTIYPPDRPLPAVTKPGISSGSMVRRGQKPREPMRILFLAANPNDTSRDVLQEECAAIERELQLAPHGGDFEFRSKWVVTVDEMSRYLLELEPTIIHFSGHGRRDAPDAEAATLHDGDSGIFLRTEQKRAQRVSGRALAQLIKAATPSARVVVLSACYSDGHAEALCQVVDCVVGVTRAIENEAARSFAAAFYRALGNRRSVGNAFAFAVATLEATHLPDDSHPRCRTRDWIDADQIRLT
jgi:CHAT domain-containing protein